MQPFGYPLDEEKNISHKFHDVYMMFDSDMNFTVRSMLKLFFRPEFLSIDLKKARIFTSKYDLLT